MALKIVIMVNQVDGRMRRLQEASAKFDMPLVILGEGTENWRNSFKIKLLFDFLDSDQVLQDDLILVLDAFDVHVHAVNDIEKLYADLNADVVFSAEANYYFRNPELSLKYWRNYPRQENSIYHFLNSGTFIGRASGIKRLLLDIEKAYHLDFNNTQQLWEVRSDQYLYSRFYVDSVSGSVKSEVSMRLDEHQRIFGCPGGRMCVKEWETISEIQDYLFFKYERRMLKTFGMKHHQSRCRDLKYDSDAAQFRNVKTGSSPLIIHLPGTYDQFDAALNQIMQPETKTRVAVFSWTLSGIAWIRSIFNFWYIRRKNDGIALVNQIFGIIVNDGKIKRLDPEKVYKSNFPKDNPFTI